MTQRVFDVDNEKDMQDLWDILPDEVYSIKRGICDSDIKLWYKTKGGKISTDCYIANFLKINWHNKTYIARPVYEITNQDIGKICCFWKEKQKIYGKLHRIQKGVSGAKTYFINNYDSYPNCRRLTNQEIEELC